MIGIDVYIEKSQLPKLKKGEHYWEDLIGLEVVNRSNLYVKRFSPSPERQKGH
jgi:ribosomal 30S subunit maturation factor RimM